MPKFKLVNTGPDRFKLAISGLDSKNTGKGKTMASTSTKKATASTPSRKPANDPRRSAKAPPAGKPAAKPAKPNKAADKFGGFKLSEIIPEDAFVYQTGEKSFFIGTYSSFTPDGADEARNMVMFTKGYVKDDEIRLSGRSATIEQEVLNDPEKGPAFIEKLMEWLASFVQE